MGDVDISKKEDEFVNACKRGDLATAKQIKAEYDVDINAQCGDALTDSCYNGHLDVVQWLVSLKMNIHYNNEIAFVWSCYNGQLAIAQYLVSLGGVDIHAQHDRAFRLCCLNEHLDVAQWLWSLGGVDVSAYDDDAFINSCIGNQLKVAKWLVSLGGVDIHASDNYAIIHSCRNGHADIVKWIWSLGGIDVNVIGDTIFAECYILDRRAVTQWLFIMGYDCEWRGNKICQWIRDDCVARRFVRRWQTFVMRRRALNMAVMY